MATSAEQFLTTYLTNASPTGHEASGQRIWLDYLSSVYDTHLTDTYGTAVAILNPDAPYKVVIEAHADEISWVVNYIDDQGYLYVARNGGVDHQIAPSMRVHVRTEKGNLPGIFGWPAIHVRDFHKEEAPSMKNLFVDIGVKTKKEALEAGVKVGQVVTYCEPPLRMRDYWVGRGLDNRMGGFIIAEAFRRIAQERPEFGVYAVNAVQEEIGLHGAEMISRRLAPDLALIVDVCHDTASPPYNKKEQGDQSCGNGPVITFGASVHRNLANAVEQVATDQKIPYQRSAAGRYTGTDTDAFAYSATGVASALLSLPLKYMHTTVETAHIDDIENCIKLLTAFVQQLPNGTTYSYL